MNYETHESETPLNEFNRLFEELTGIKPQDAVKGDDGFLYIPINAEIGKRSPVQRKRIEELAGPLGWRNNITDGRYDGWWIRPPEE